MVCFLVRGPTAGPRAAGAAAAGRLGVSAGSEGSLLRASEPESRLCVSRTCLELPTNAATSTFAMRSSTDSPPLLRGGPRDRLSSSVPMNVMGANSVKLIRFPLRSAEEERFKEKKTKVHAKSTTCAVYNLRAHCLPPPPPCPSPPHPPRLPHIPAGPHRKLSASLGTSLLGYHQLSFSSTSLFFVILPW